MIILTNAASRPVSMTLAEAREASPLDQDSRGPGLNHGGGTKTRDWPRGSSLELKHKISVSAVEDY